LFWIKTDKLDSPVLSLLADDQGSGVSSMMQDLAFAIPGVDEAMGFAEVMKYVLPANLHSLKSSTSSIGHKSLTETFDNSVKSI
jgi:hypothetical protein